MYIQITTRCNMNCWHCGFDCTEEGEDMSLETFRKAIQWEEESLTIGGGEPTLHPLFWQFIGESLAVSNYVWLATNGSQTKTALALAKLAKKGVLGCDLSRDNYHDDIDPAVVEAFTKGKISSSFGNTSNDMRGIRDVSGREINSGRCDFGKDDCVCADVLCTPGGIILACGCGDSPQLGTIDGYTIPEEWGYGECYKDQPEIKQECTI